MINNNIEYKEKLLNTGIFKRVSEGQYTCQECPFCGDRKRHMYVRISLTDDVPVMYNCFKCNSHGIMNKKFLEYFNLENIQIPRNSYRKKIDIPKVSSSNSIITVCENDDIIDICNYIESRVGKYPTLSELQYFQYIGNPGEYVKEYFGDNNNQRMFFNRGWFKLTNGGMTGRWYGDDTKQRWRKYNNHQAKSVGLYTMKIPFDLYKPINVYIAEGIMDVIGLYYNYTQDNNIYIACLGRNYSYGMKHLVSMGIFGKSVNIKIFKDSDVKTSDIQIDGHLRKLFGKVEIYRNAMSKDYGILPDKLEIEKCL